MAGRGKCKWLHGREMGGLWYLCVCASEMCRHTHHPLSPHTLRPKANPIISSEIHPGLFSAFCSWFHLQPWTVTEGLCWREFRFSNHWPVPQSSSFRSWRNFHLALTREARGPWLKPQISKKNVKPLELVILLSDINTHFKRISLLLPLKHVLVLSSTLNM